jgi:hypothetical protein
LDQQKVATLREHVIEGKAVSRLCDKYHIHPATRRSLRRNSRASMQFSKMITDLTSDLSQVADFL